MCPHAVPKPPELKSAVANINSPFEYRIIRPPTAEYPNALLSPGTDPLCELWEGGGLSLDPEESELDDEEELDELEDEEEELDELELDELDDDEELDELELELEELDDDEELDELELEDEELELDGFDDEPDELEDDELDEEELEELEELDELLGGGSIGHVSPLDRSGPPKPLTAAA